MDIETLVMIIRQMINAQWDLAEFSLEVEQEMKIQEGLNISAQKAKNNIVSQLDSS